jgi:hypothetical protein
MLVETYSIGAVYEVAEPAAILGLNKSIYVYRKTSGVSAGSEWLFGSTPLPPAAPVFRSSGTFGLEIDATSLAQRA